MGGSENGVYPNSFCFKIDNTMISHGIVGGTVFSRHTDIGTGVMLSVMITPLSRSRRPPGDCP